MMHANFRIDLFHSIIEKKDPNSTKIGIIFSILNVKVTEMGLLLFSL